MQRPSVPPCAAHKLLGRYLEAVFAAGIHPVESKTGQLMLKGIWIFRGSGSSALKAIPELTNTMSFFPAKSVSTHALESHLSTQACKN